MQERPTVHDPKNTRVRPRLVWVGIGLGIVALGVAGVALMTGLMWLAYLGGATVVAGLLLAWYGGVEFDTRGQEPPHHELKEVLDGASHTGTSPASHVVGPQVEENAARRTRQATRLMARSTGGPWRELRTMGAFGLVALGIWLLLGTALLGYPFTVRGQDAALRDVGFAVVLTLAGLRLRLQRRSLLATAVCLCVGALLLLSAVTLPHDSASVRWNELLCGLIVVVLASLTFSPGHLEKPAST
jgi:hypothetical protein